MTARSEAPTAASVASRLRAAISETGGSMGVLLRDACRVIEGAPPAPADALQYDPDHVAFRPVDAGDHEVQRDCMPGATLEERLRGPSSLAAALATLRYHRDQGTLLPEVHLSVSIVLHNLSRPALTPPAGEVEHEWPCEQADGGAERCEDANCPASVEPALARLRTIGYGPKCARPDYLGTISARDAYVLHEHVRALAAQAREAEGLRARVAELEGEMESARRAMEKNATRLDRVSTYAIKHGPDVSVTKALAGICEDLTVHAIRLANVSARAAETGGGE